MLWQSTITLLMWVSFLTASSNNSYRREVNTCANKKKDEPDFKETCQKKAASGESDVTQMRKTIARLEKEVLGLRLQVNECPLNRLHGVLLMLSYFYS